MKKAELNTPQNSTVIAIYYNYDENGKRLNSFWGHIESEYGSSGVQGLELVGIEKIMKDIRKGQKSEIKLLGEYVTLEEMNWGRIIRAKEGLFKWDKEKEEYILI